VISVDEELYADVQGLAAQVSNANNDWANRGKKSNPVHERMIVENGTSAVFTGKFTEHGKDTDANGLFNFISVEAEINVTKTGTYSLLGVLSNGGNYFSADNNSFFFEIGIHNFTLYFDGIEFRKQRINGSFHLDEIVLFSRNRSDNRENVLDTISYKFKQFEQPPAEIMNDFSNQ